MPSRRHKMLYNLLMPNYRRLFIQNSYIFIVMVTYKRKPILIDNIELLRDSFKRAKQTYNFEIFGSVILPDHMHLLLRPENIKEYPKIIRAIKYNFSEKFNDGTIAIVPYEKDNCRSRAGLLARRHKGVWQQRYYEHTIRDEDELYKHLDYIHYNPVKHGLVKNVKDWGFSSFDKFVKFGNYELDWGLTDQIKHIETLDYD